MSRATRRPLWWRCPQTGAWEGYECPDCGELTDHTEPGDRCEFAPTTTPQETR